MAFNSGQFNSQQFNTGADQVRAINFSRHGIVIIGADIGITTQAFFVRTGSVQIWGNTSAHIVRRFKRTGRATIRAAVSAGKLMNAERTGRVTVGNKLTHVGKLMNAARDGRTLLGNETYVGKLMNATRIVQASFGNETHVGKVISVAREQMTVIGAFVLMGTRVESITTINVRIPPNSELRINSDNFTATVHTRVPWGGVGGWIASALPYYEGDWIFFDRDTVELNIQASAGWPFEASVEGSEVIYNQRYI
ncbi:MAG: hypothetical protein FWE08_03865 [Oscillospiraceae bacterium]|nr:hypothetical protein [Oscillospiraceae bacterium]